MTLSIVSGLLVALLVLIISFLWRRSQNSPFVARLMARDEYLDLVIKVSSKVEHKSIALMSPRLRPRSSNRKLAELQDQWCDAKTSVRVLTTNNDSSLRAGLELDARGMEVRYLSATGIDDEALSFHIFANDDRRFAIVNEKTIGHHVKNDAVTRLEGRPLTQVLSSRFEGLWKSAQSVNDVLVGRVLATASSLDSNTLRSAVSELEASNLFLSKTRKEALLLHLGILAQASEIFVTGPPGAGKSTARRALQEVLGEFDVPCATATDYIELYRLFLSDVLVDHSSAFEIGPMGSFVVKDPTTLERAFARSLERLRKDTPDVGVAIFEFARNDAFDYLERLDGGHHTHVLNIETPEPVRDGRLDARRSPPHITLRGSVALEIVVGDEHFVPKAAREKHYSDSQVTSSAGSEARWKDRVTKINGELKSGELENQLRTLLLGMSL